MEHETGSHGSKVTRRIMLLSVIYPCHGACGGVVALILKSSTPFHDGVQGWGYLARRPSCVLAISSK